MKLIAVLGLGLLVCPEVFARPPVVLDGHYAPFNAARRAANGVARVLYPFPRQATDSKAAADVPTPTPTPTPTPSPTPTPTPTPTPSPSQDTPTPTPTPTTSSPAQSSPPAVSSTPPPATTANAITTHSGSVSYVNSVSTDSDGGLFTVIQTIFNTGTLTSSTPSPSASATGDQDNSTGLGAKSIAGLAVAGSLLVLGIAAFVWWKLSRKRFSDFDHDDAIKWPDLNDDTAMHTMPARSEGGGTQSGRNSESHSEMTHPTMHNYYDNQSVSSVADLTRQPVEHAPTGTYYDNPSVPGYDPNAYSQPLEGDRTSGYYDPYSGPVPQTLATPTAEAQGIPTGRQSPGPNAAYGPRAASPGPNLAYGARSTSPGPNAMMYGQRAPSPGPNMAYGRSTSPNPNMAYGRSPSPGPNMAYAVRSPSPGPNVAYAQVAAPPAYSGRTSPGSNAINQAPQ